MTEETALKPLPIELRLALSDMFERYGEAVDDGEFQRWPEFFTDDCLYRVTSRENHAAGLSHADLHCEGLAMVRDRADALSDSTVYEPRAMRHIIAMPRAGLAAGGWIEARTNFLVVEALSDDDPQVCMSGIYLDVVVPQAGDLRFRQRLCVYDNYRIRTSLVHPV